MAVMTDPTDLVDPTSIQVTPATKLIKLNVAGNLTTDGVTLKCVYSKLKELWKDDANYIKYPFPMQPITDEQFELINGWNFDNSHATPSNKTCNLIRTGGWRIYASDNTTVTEEWAGIISLGSLITGSQVYYQTESVTGTATDVVLTGPVNQAVQVYGDLTHGDFDTRDYMKLFVRKDPVAGPTGYTYASVDLPAIGVSTMTYQVYRFPLSNAVDLKIQHLDADMAGAPYSGMHLTWYAAPQNKTIGGSSYPFHVIINGNNGTAQQIYEWVQYKLRQDADIDESAGTTHNGKVTSELLRFVGDTLYTIKQSEGGVFIDNLGAVDVNNVNFADDNFAGTYRSYPYVASITFQFGDTLVADGSAIYHVYFTNDDAGNNAGNDFGTSGAITVNDGEAVPAEMSGTISGNASIAKTYDYDGNVQRGAASAGQPAPITVVAIGLNTAQYVKAVGSITRSKSNVVSLVAALERNYSNPA